MSKKKSVGSVLVTLFASPDGDTLTQRERDLVVREAESIVREFWEMEECKVEVKPRKKQRN